MLYSEIRKKEVVNMRDCRKLGHVVDMDIDECNGCIRRINGVVLIMCRVAAVGFAGNRNI